MYNKEFFKEIVFYKIKQNNLTYREVEKKTGVDKSTLTRINKLEQIELVPFLLLIQWIWSDISLVDLTDILNLDYINHRSNGTILFFILGLFKII